MAYKSYLNDNIKIIKNNKMTTAAECFLSHATIIIYKLFILIYN